MPRLAVEKWEQEHRRHIAEYLSEIDELYQVVTDDMVRLGMSYAYDPATGRPFCFSQNKSRSRSAAQTITAMHEKLTGIISAGIATEWAFANDKCDSWVKSMFSDPKRGYMLHNLEALDAFLHRKSYGHTFSERVWDYAKQFQEHVEMALSVGISEGRSAAAISRDVRGCLKEPDKLFRRVRDRFGNLVLSRSAQAYHPGQGVYRSSYQNAMRMARTEINAAYREADSIRWQQLDFIVGFEVKTSKSHAAWLTKFWYPRFKKGSAPLEICDAMEGRYPKDFKFIGWHPNCKCYAVPIIANEGTDRDFWEEPLNEVKDVPDNFKRWVEDNAERIAVAEYKGTTPYFLSENDKYVGLSKLRSQLNLSQIRAAVARGGETQTIPLLTNGKLNFTTARKAIHERIISDYMKGYAAKSDVVYMLGGATANGKSTLVESGLLPHPKGALVIDSDKIKAMIPEYRAILASGKKDLVNAAANFVHEESSFIGKEIQGRAMHKGLASVFDGINNKSADKVAEKIAQLKQQSGGKRIRADYVSLDTELSFKLAEARAKKTGREVPLDVITQSNRGVSAMMPEVIERKLFDELYLWDTNMNGKPRLILKQIDGVLTIEDKELYERFLKKAKE